MSQPVADAIADAVAMTDDDFASMMEAETGERPADSVLGTLKARFQDGIRRDLAARAELYRSYGLDEDDIATAIRERS